jgi:hypothetical protein
MKRAMVKSLFIITLLSLVAVAQTEGGKAKGVKKPDQAGAPPSASLNPYNLDFKDQVVKKISKPQRITLTNTGGKPLYIHSAAIVDDDRDDFALGGDTCTGNTIAPGKSCVMDVNFVPSVTGKRRSTLTVNDNALDSPQRVTLTGNGINSADVPPHR